MPKTKTKNILLSIILAIFVFGGIFMAPEKVEAEEVNEEAISTWIWWGTGDSAKESCEKTLPLEHPEIVKTGSWCAGQCVSADLGDKLIQLGSTWNISEYFDTGYKCTNWQDNSVKSFLTGTHWIWGLLAKVFLVFTFIFGEALHYILTGVELLMGVAFNIPGELKEVWKTLLNFTNIVFALILVGIAIMNILRVKLDNYAIKKILPSFILAVILINLSWIICSFVLDLGLIVYNVVINISPGDSLSPSITNVIQMDRMGLMDSLTRTDIQNVNGGQVLWSFLSAVLFFILIVPATQLFFAMLIRIIVLWLLFVISPLAWLGFVVPEARAETWGKFWKALVTMSFLPARVTLYFIIGILIMDSFKSVLAPLEVTGTSAGVFSGGIFEYAKTMGTNSFSAILILIMAAAIVKIAARDAMKTEWTEAAMSIGEKAGKMIQKGGMAVASTPFTFGAKVGKKLGKKGYDKLKNSRIGDSVARAGNAVRGKASKIVGNSGKVAAWGKYNTEKARIDATSMNYPNEAARVAGEELQRNELTKAAAVRDAEIKSAVHTPQDIKLKANNDLDSAKQAWLNNSLPVMRKLPPAVVESIWKNSVEGKAAIETRDNTITAAQDAHKAKIDRRKRIWGTTKKSIQEFSPLAEVGRNIATSGAAVEGAKKVWEAWKGNAAAAKEEAALGWAKGIANLGKADFTGTLKASGFDVKGIQNSLQLKLDNDYSKHITTEQYRDMIDTGTRQQLLDEIEKIQGDAAGGSRYDQIAMEHLLHTLEQKHGAFMGTDEAFRLEKIWAEIIDKKQSGNHAENLVREGFASTSGDRLGSLRAKNLLFSNIKFGGDGQIKGFVMSKDGQVTDEMNEDGTTKFEEGMKSVLDASNWTVNNVKEAAAEDAFKKIANDDIYVNQTTSANASLLNTMGDPQALAFNGIKDSSAAAFAKVAEPNNWMNISAATQAIGMRTKQMRKEMDQTKRDLMKGEIDALNKLLDEYKKAVDTKIKPALTPDPDLTPATGESSMKFIDRLSEKVRSIVDQIEEIKQARDAVKQAQADLKNAGVNNPGGSGGKYTP